MTVDLSKREIYAGVGGLLMLFAILTNRLLGLDMPGADTGVGLRGIRVCAGGQCASIDEGTMLGSMAFFVGLFATAAVVGAAALDRLYDEDGLWRPAGMLALFWLLTVAIWYIDFPGHQVLSLSIGFYAAIIGVALVSSASLRSAQSDSGGLERARSREEEIEAKVAAFSNASVVAEATVEKSTAEEAAVEESTVEKSAEAAPEATLVAKVDLRFIAESVQIGDDGVFAKNSDGGEHHVRFSEMSQLVARLLPEELGHGPVPLLDIIAGEEAREPLRILPETVVNYAFLPEGASDEVEENVRRLIRLMLALQPEISMDEGSRRFAEGTGQALPFQSLEHFREYDSRYPASPPAGT